MATIALLHGFNVRDGGDATVERWAAPLEAAGHLVLRDALDYGWVGLLGARLSDEAVARRVAELARQRPGLVLVAHSHGGNIAHQAVRDHGAAFDLLVLVNPALRRDAEFGPGAKRVLCFYAPSDRALQGALLLRWLPWNWFSPHPWGAAGKFGLLHTSESRVNVNLDQLHPHYLQAGHSGAFKDAALAQVCVQRVLDALGAAGVPRTTARLSSTPQSSIT